MIDVAEIVDAKRPEPEKRPESTETRAYLAQLDAARHLLTDVGYDDYEVVDVTP